MQPVLLVLINHRNDNSVKLHYNGLVLYVIVNYKENKPHIKNDEFLIIIIVINYKFYFSVFSFAEFYFSNSKILFHKKPNN